MKNVAVTAGASAPEHLVQELIEFLRDLGFREMEEIELVDEDVRFSLPSELIDLDPMSASRTDRQHAGIRRRTGDAPRGAPTSPACRPRDGHWCAELTADTTLESDYILFQLWLHPPVERRSGTRPRGR